MSPQMADMKVWSQPPGTSLDQIASYTFQEEVPGKARVYILDSGAMAEHDVSQYKHFYVTTYLPS